MNSAKNGTNLRNKLRTSALQKLCLRKEHIPWFKACRQHCSSAIVTRNLLSLVLPALAAVPAAAAFVNRASNRVAVMDTLHVLCFLFMSCGFMPLLDMNCCSTASCGGTKRNLRRLLLWLWRTFEHTGLWRVVSTAFTRDCTHCSRQLMFYLRESFVWFRRLPNNLAQVNAQSAWRVRYIELSHHNTFVTQSSQMCNLQRRRHFAI